MAGTVWASTGSQKRHRSSEEGRKPKRAKEALLTRPLRKLSRVSVDWNKRCGKLGSEVALHCLLPAVLEEGLE